MKTAPAILAVAVVIVSFGFLTGQFYDVPDTPGGIQFFKGTWKEAVAKANAEHKPIFLDVYATWCGPCRQLKRKTFPDQAAGTYFNEHYVNVSIDGETEEGKQLLEQYTLHAYPSLLIIRADQKQVALEVGFHSADWLLDFGKSNFEKALAK